MRYPNLHKMLLEIDPITPHSKPAPYFSSHSRYQLTTLNGHKYTFALSDRVITATGYPDDNARQTLRPAGLFRKL